MLERKPAAGHALPAVQLHARALLPPNQPTPPRIPLQAAHSASGAGASSGRPTSPHYAYPDHGHRMAFVLKPLPHTEDEERQEEAPLQQEAPLLAPQTPDTETASGRR